MGRGFLSSTIRLCVEQIREMGNITRVTLYFSEVVGLSLDESEALSSKIN